MLAVLFAVHAFAGPCTVPQRLARTAVTHPSAGLITMGYVPDGMTKEQYEQMKAKERARKGNLGVFGVTTFKSRELDARAADEAKAQGTPKRYRFPDKESGNKNNYVRRAGGREAFRSSQEFAQLQREREAELQRKRAESAKVTGASGGVMNFGMNFGKKPKATQAAPPAKKPAGGNLFGGLFGKK